ncbi:hypothetical protein ABE473_06360 [Stenotrophomonas sp. TWI700]|uniref:hypothetical protein n=1 Tax=Stenotrophomonas sp. TWI700 TaxID=3136792 RepID=UPI0032081C93
MTLAAVIAPSAPTSEVIVAVCGAIIAALALGTSFYFGWLQRKHFRLSSRPILDVEVGCIDEILGLANEGVGPAFVERFTATLDGVEIDLLSGDGIDTFISELLSGADTRPYLRVRGLLKGSVLAAGGSVRMVYSEAPLAIDHRNLIRLNYERVRLHAEYRCIYDNQFVVSHRGFG